MRCVPPLSFFGKPEGDFKEVFLMILKSTMALKRRTSFFGEGARVCEETL